MGGRMSSIWLRFGCSSRAALAVHQVLLRGPKVPAGDRRPQENLEPGACGAFRGVLDHQGLNAGKDGMNILFYR